MRKVVRHFCFGMFTILAAQGAFAQSKKITGQVVSSGDGLPLPGATVLIKGTQQGVSTDMDGKFTINADKDAVLVIDFIGFSKVEKKVGAQTVINAKLVEDTGTLDEIKITTGYETVNKRTFTGAVSRISEKELKVDGMPDVSRMIEGKAAGVSVQNVTGTFGAAPKITVRGSSSIFGDTKPLWVIDGVVQEEIINVSFQDLASGNASTMLSSAVAGLNANDVLSIEILKDAAATSMYGARAMNGVVVITTKSGRKDTPLKVTYNVENTLRETPSYTAFDITNSQQTMGILSEMEGRGLLTGPAVAQGKSGGVYNLLYNAKHRYNPTGGYDGQGGYDLYNNAVNQNEFLRQYEYANTDWFKELFRPSIMQNHSLSFSGGGQSAAYYASVSYLNDPGWTIADKVNRLTMNLKTTFFLNDRLTLSLSSNASIRNQKAPGSFDRTEDAVGGTIGRDFDINPFNYALNTSRALRPYANNGDLEYYRQNWAPFNILNETNSNYMDLNVKDIKFQVELDYKLADGLKYNTTAAIRYVDSNREHTITEHSNASAAFRAAETKIVKDENIYLYKDPENPDAQKQVVMKEGGMLHAYDNSMTAINWKNMLNYDKVFGEKSQHELNAVVGTEMRSIDRKFKTNSNYGIMFDKGNTLSTDPRLMAKLIGEGDYMFKMGDERDRTVGFLGKVTYTYDGKYTGSVTGRTDASNQQGGGSTMWLPTWTVSGKWNAKQEKFLIDNNTISDFSLRGSYGLTATAGPASNSLAIFKNALTVSRLRPYDRETGLAIESLQNSNLTFEKQYEANLGFDFGLANNRIYLSGDVYQRKAFDLVDYVTTSGIGGEDVKLGNNADMTTKGIEGSLTTRNIVSKDFKWTTNLNVSFYDQEITKLADTPRVYDLVKGTGGNVVGGARNTLYSYVFTGLDKNGMPTFVMPDGVTDNIGGANFQDRQNITAYLKKEGAVEPNKTLGFTNNFQYKNWSLDVLVVASAGNVVRLDPIFASKYNDTQNFTKAMNNRWVLAGDEYRTNVPRIADASTIATEGDDYMKVVYNTYNYSTERVAKGDFVRLKNITLGYEFPEQMKKKIGFSTFSLKMSVTNPFLIYSDKKLNGQDPEFFRVGGVAMPITRQYTLTLNLSI